ncbi:LysM peptidoglycan-binding domain-containing protein [Radiobacillus kanasensis]|uniref:LysM peptidoglycan-binding domain-containing protein n=1 Tax=Radiobacillus kanasensis TaxID=2844358 RepID=UPI001E2C58ED|nr:LysM peptidoglycan-binding domain-containing protein [Radiobacillus kanasensis]UFU00213.1 LysM peptidoglycan-binding domain-containing protein [Radiobacillus kanasensis]
MDQIKGFQLEKTNPQTDEYTLIVYLDDHLTEFADELGRIPQRKQNITTTIKQVVKTRYPNVRITMAKVIISGAVITTIPIMAQSTVHAAESNPATSQVLDATSIYYHVASGDTLWIVSKKFNTSVDQIKRANNLKTDTLLVNQQLIIPKAFHTIGVGDYLTVLARDYDVSVDAIKKANGLTTDATKLGQTLTIPTLINSQVDQSTATVSEPKTQASSSSYTVVSGDSLSVIAKRFNVSVDDLRKVNGLTSDFIGVGQVLTIPDGGTTPVETQPVNPTGNTTNYTVKSGDSLSVIAKHYGTTVEALRSENNLTSDFIAMGQTLKVPTSETSDITTPEQTTGSYTVVSGDSLSVIAKRFNNSVDELRNANGLTSDFLRVGQVLIIPDGGTTAVEKPANPTGNTNDYTVQSGDSLSVIAKRFGTTVEALKVENHLTSDILRVGQVLTIPTDTTPPTPTTETVKEDRTTFVYSVRSGDSLSVIAKRFAVTVDDIRTANQLRSDSLQVGQALTIPNGLHAPTQTGTNTISYKTHTVQSGDNIWDLSVQYGIPQAELLRANNLTTKSMLSIGQTLKIPVHNIAVKTVVSAKHGEYLDWWTEAQYVFAIGKTAKVTDVVTGKSFNIKRTIGANHADSETVTVADSNMAKSIWGGYSWRPRAVLLEVDGRKLAASMSFFPHEREYIMNNGITGHFDVYFGNSTRHVDGKADASHQAQVEKAAGIR